jgi:membrane fusion protein (multidrug efflux system)
MESHEMKNRVLKRIWKMLPALSLILLIIIILVMSSRIKTEGDRIAAEKLASLQKDRPPVNVVVLDIMPSSMYDRIDLPAQVEPWVELKILAEVSGQAVRVAAKEGSRVTKGDLIAQLDSRDYENQLASVKAEYELAKLDLQRNSSLFTEQLITRAQLDQAIAKVNTIEASVKNAKLKVERAAIRAPISGLVNHLDVKEGLFMNMHDPVGVILDNSRVKVTVGIPEADVNEIKKLSHFDVTIEALGNIILKGKKHFLSQSPETLAHLYKLEIEVDNSNGAILPGMFARVNIVKREIRDSYSAPLYSVISRNDEQYIYVEKDGIAHVRIVETGILEGWKIEIKKGLSKGDRMIVVGHRNVDEGQEVNVVRTVSDPEDLFK